MAHNWGLIASGATFHALVGNLLLHEDSATRIFNREGADGAIDALSGDRTTVFQSKYHKNGTATNVFSDARAELAKIVKYRAGGRWQPIWAHVSSWMLITNVSFGPGDDKTWNDEIVLAFAKHNLRAEYVLQPQLEKMLAAHPGVADAFFGQRPRLFISLAEHREALVAREVLERAYDVAIEGRDADLDAIASFVRNGNHQVLLVHGPGGVGKSRLLFEAATRLVAAGDVETVYCGTPHLAHSDNWYVGIVPETKALVILDEPVDASFVERFLAELRTRTKQWKVVVGVRTPRDPVIQALTDPRERRLLAPPRELKPLQPDAATRYARNLLAPLALSEAERSRAVRWLLDGCGCVPIWMTVAVELLERRADLRDLPKDEFELAHRYIRESVENTPSSVTDARHMSRLLHGIALAQPVNRLADEDRAALAQLSDLDVGTVEAAIEDLVRRRVVTAFGIERRMVEVRPAVVRDHLLIDWLTVLIADVRRPSAAARELAQELASLGAVSPFTKRIIKTLGRVEYISRIATPLLDPIADAAARLAEAATDTRGQLTALEFATTIGSSRPGHLARVVRILRTHEVPETRENTPFGIHVQTRSNVIDLLPWQLFLAAHAASDATSRKLILDELVSLTDLREQGPGDFRRYTGGKAAYELLPRILHERHGYRSAFHAEAAAIAAGMIDELARTDHPRPSIKVLVTALLEIGRHDAFDDAADPNTWHFETFAVTPAGELGRIAMSLRDRLWQNLEAPGASPEARDMCWVLLDHFHSQLNQHKRDATWRALLENDLDRARTLVENTATCLEDVQAARRLWRWHLQYERNEDTKRIATACETAYLARPLLARFAAIFGFDRSGTRLDEAARTFTPPRDIAELDAFMTDALQYANTHPDERQVERVQSFACYLGELYASSLAVYRDFIEGHVREGDNDRLFDVALQMACGYLQSIRSSGDPTTVARALERVVSCAVDEESRARLITALYVNPGPVSARNFSAVDYEFLTRHWAAFSALPTFQFFLVLGRLVAARNEALDRALERLADLDGDQQSIALGTMWQGYFDTLPYPFSSNEVSPIAASLLDAFAMLPDARGPQGNLEWAIQEVSKHLPRRPLTYLVDLVRRRLAAYGENNRRMQDGDRQWIHILPGEDSFVFDQVDLIDDSAPDAASIATIEEMLSLEQADMTIAFDLPEFLVRVDPHGRVVPRLIADRIRDPHHTPTLDALSEATRVAGWYAVNGAAWRTIASAACARLAAIAGDDKNARNDVYSRLTSHRIQSWSGTAGQIHPRWQAAIDEAREGTDRETDEGLRGFWEWSLCVAERDLEVEHGQLEERKR